MKFSFYKQILFFKHAIRIVIQCHLSSLIVRVFSPIKWFRFSIVIVSTTVDFFVIYKIIIWWHQNDLNIKVHRILYVDIHQYFIEIIYWLFSFITKTKLENILKSKFQIFIEIKLIILIFFSTHIIDVQTKLSERAIELLNLPDEESCLVLDIGHEEKYLKQKMFILLFFYSDVVLDWVEKY